MNKIDDFFDDEDLNDQIETQTGEVEQETEYYPDGTVKAVSEFLDGVLHGSCKEFYPNGMMREISSWKKGQKRGRCATFFENGQLKELGFLVGIESYDGIYLEFYENGVLKMQASFADGIEHGPFRGRFKNGIVSEEGTYCHGKLDGEYRIYYDNGQLKEKIDCYCGQYDGDYIIYYPNGQIKEQAEFLDDMRDGVRCTYYEDGTPKSQATYKKDYRVGSYRKFYPNGQVRLSANYTQDIPSELHGDLKVYSEKGQLLYLAKYDQGDRITAVVWNKQETNEQMEKRAAELFEKTMAQIRADEATPCKITSHNVRQKLPDNENIKK